MSSPATNVSLLVATLDLKLVQLIRGAMRAADAGAAAGAVDGVPSPAATFEPRRTIHPEPTYAPRRVIHPEPRFEPRPVLRPEKCKTDCAPYSAPCAPELPHKITPSPIQPPWAVLPWQNPPPPAQVVKVPQYRPDNVRRGAIIDCFL